jgi:hypothetical protein
MYLFLIDYTFLLQVLLHQINPRKIHLMYTYYDSLSKKLVAIVETSPEAEDSRPLIVEGVHGEGGL